MDPVTAALVQYGAVGLIAILALMIARTLFAKLLETAALERQRADRLEDELRKLNETVRSEYIGTLAESGRNLAEAIKAVTDALAAIRASR